MSSLGFGLERLGLAAIRWPRLALGLLLLASIAAAYGVSRLSVDASIDGFLRSHTPENARYAEFKSLFPASEHDVLAIVEHDNLLRPAALENILNLHFELGFSEYVKDVMSIFSIHDPPDDTGIARPVIPDDIPRGADFDELAARIAAHPLINDRLLTVNDRDGQLTLMVISLKPELVGKLEAAVDDISRTLDQTLSHSDLRVRLAGFPVIHTETLGGIRRDQLVFNSFGMLIGFFISWMFFRRLVFVFIVSIAPPISALWALGLLGYWGQEINVFVNVIPLLIMVITYCDAMHLTFSIRRQMREGRDRFAAVRHAVMTVGPACVLTSLTTSLALLSLTVTDLDLIRSFGFSAAAGTLLAFLTVITVVPVLSVLLLREEHLQSPNGGRDQGAMGLLDVMCAHLAGFVGRFPRLIVVAGVIAVPVFAVLYFQLEPSYRPINHVPKGKQTIAASQRLDEALGGSYPIHIMLRWPEALGFRSDEVLRVVEDVHELMAANGQISGVSSLVTMKRWLDAGGAGHGRGDDRLFSNYLDKMPEHHRSRFLNENGRAAIVTGRLPNIEAREIAVIVADLERRLDHLRKDYPGYAFGVTGLSAILAVQMPSMIYQLNQGLALAILIGIGLIGVAFRSSGAAFLSALPNVFPVVAAGAAVFVLGEGLQVATVVALTIAFGLAVDDTIHFLSRLHLERGSDAGNGEAVSQTLVHIGPVLMLTTLVIICGVSGVLLSSFSATILFGKLMMITLAAALVGDLLILPALVTVLRQLLQR